MSSSITTFGDLAAHGWIEFGDGYRTKRSELGTPGLPILRVGDVLDGRISPSYTDFVRESFRSAMGPKVSRAGDVVLTTKGTVGRVAMIPASAPQFVYSPQVCYFRTTRPDGPLNIRYLYYWLKSPSFKRQVERLKSQTDMADYINLADLRSLRVAIPPLRDQIAVVEVLGALDDKIAANEGVARTAKELATLVAQVTTTRVALGSLVTYVREQVSPARIDARFVEYFSIPAYDNRRLPDLVPPSTIKSSKFVVPAGAVLLSKLNPATPRVWDARPSGEHPALASTEFLVLLPRDNISSAELWAVCAQNEVTNQLASKVTGTSNSHQRARPDDILTTEVRDPRTLRPDHRALINALADQAAAARNESEPLAQLRDTLLPRLMSGEIRVREAEKAVEEVL